MPGAVDVYFFNARQSTYQAKIRNGLAFYASDSNNGKLNYHYADLREKEKLLLQNIFKNKKIEPEEKKRKKQEIRAKKNRKKKEKQEYYSKNRKKQDCATPGNHFHI